MSSQGDSGGLDAALRDVAAAIRAADPDGSRTARVLRETIDQLYDGQRSGRYRWDQLYKTEKTHCGTLVEINMQREFQFLDGVTLDYLIAGVEVDCKYSQARYAWMIPPEARDHLCLAIWASDNEARWGMGLVRATDERLNIGDNRDRKVTLNAVGRAAVQWLFDDAALPPNVLLQLDRATVSRVLALKSGQQRVNELFRVALGLIVSRGVVATVAQQDDYMKRVRANGGARSALRPEGILVLGQFESHQRVARELHIPVPGPGESISIRVVTAESAGPGVALIDGGFWRVARADDPITIAPRLPTTRRKGIRGQ